jgi:hypothetical protein
MIQYDDAIEVFRTENGVLSQCDKTESYLLNYQSRELPLKICELIKLKNKLSEIDIVKMLAVESPDIEVIYLHQTDRFFILSIADVLELRSLLNGTFAMLELNSLIHRALFRQ